MARSFIFKETAQTMVRSFTFTILSFLLSLQGSGQSYSYVGICDNGICLLDSTGTSYQQIHQFQDTSLGYFPHSPLALDDSGNVYGATNHGGANYRGVLYRFHIPSSTYTVMLDLDSATGLNYWSGLTRLSDGKIYGNAYEGGTDSAGALMRYDPVLDSLELIYNYNRWIEGYSPGLLPVEHSNGKIYTSTTHSPLTNDRIGNLIEYDPIGDSVSGIWPFVNHISGGLNYFNEMVEDSNGILYGTLDIGWWWSGTIFSFDPSTQTLNNVHQFNDTLGSYAYDGVILASNGRLYGTAWDGGDFLKGILFEFDLALDTFKALRHFRITDNGHNGGWVNEVSPGLLMGSGNGGFYAYDIALDSMWNLASMPFGKLSRYNGCGVFAGISRDSISYMADSTLTNQTGVNYQWLDCNNGMTAVNGATSSSFTPTTVSGSYAIAVEKNGCVDTSACISYDFTSVKESSVSHLQVYPNPFEEEMIIRGRQSAEVQIIDMLGRSVDLIPMQELGELRYDFHEVPSGVYLVLDLVSQEAHRIVKR